jgi:hypothetical protein
MQITKETIEQLRKLTEENQVLTLEISDELGAIKRDNKDQLHKVTRNGQEQEVKELYLWEEVFHQGIESEAGQILGAKYPELWVKVKKQEEIVKGIEDISVNNLGFNFKEMNLVNLIDLILTVKEL